jgi:hypothetical protein
MIIGARAIVRAKVLSIESGFDEQHTRIYTYVTLKVQEVLKGQITERKIVIKELGGQVGDRISVIYGNPHFTRGERVLLYLDTWKDGSLRTYQMFLGKFSIVRDAKTGHEFAVRDGVDENVVVLPASKGAARGTSTDRMELSTYLEMVRSRLAANIERSRTFEETYYHNVPKLAAPPDYYRGRGDIEPQFTLISPSNPARWPEPDSNQPVSYTVNPDGAPNAQIVNDVAAAANTWSVVPGCALRVSFSGSLDQCYTISGTPGINVVFNNCDGRNAASPTCASILAWGGYSGARFAPKVISGTTFNFEITQGFISFNPYASCNFGNSCIVQEITTHEMGHALGLGHSADSTATMFAFAHFDGRCASIKQDDANGIAFIYPSSGGGGPGPLSIVTSTLTGGTVGSAYSQTMVASGGTPPYHWSVVAGNGNLPPGLTLSDSGVLSGNPTTAGTYNFTIRATDSGSGSAQRAFSIVVSAAGTAFDAQFLSQTVSTTLTPGQVFVANLVWLNTGTQTWDGPSGALRLVSQNPFNNTTWGGNTVLLSPFTVPAGQQLNVSFQAVAPSTPGTYNFQWQLARDATSLFGQMSANVSITVGSGGGGGGGGTNGATFVTQSVPAAMTAGQTAAVSLTMNNSGTTTWSPGTYLLASLNPAGNSVWGSSQVALSSSVAPGSNATFSFNITAPSTAGTYNFQWGMTQSGVGSFGSPSTNVAVAVTGGGGGGGGNNSQFMSQTVPGTWVPGQTYSVTVSMKNTGTVAWATSSYKLGSQSPANNTDWGLSRASLNKNVPPGSLGTFIFTVRAPSTPGTYNFQWQVIQEGVGFFGAMTPNMPLNNGGGGGGTNGATFVTQSVPAAMTAGQTAAVSLTMNNSGTTTWSPGTYLLASLNPAGNSVWGSSQVALSSSVPPGSNATFNFNITAPSTAGTYNFQWGMTQSGVGSFGSPSTNVAIGVSSGGGGGTNNALFMSQSVPASMSVGQSVSVSVTMRNNGTTTWAAGSYGLQSQNLQGNSTWGLSRVNVTSPVVPGSNATFTFNVTAPSTGGTYNFQWRMIQDGAGTFGDFSSNVAVVVSSSSVPPLVITTTTLPFGQINRPYSAQVTATGGQPAYSWSLSSGSLPSGVTLNASTGLISGTPTTGGTFNFTVMVRDQGGRTASQSYKLSFR